MWKKHKLKLALVTLALSVTTVFTTGLTDNYFEISKNLDIFATLYKELNIYYVDETNPGKLMKTAIDEMLKSLDPYTNFYPESEIEDYRFMTTGEYGGIGALIRKKEDFMLIAEPYEGFPAHKAGLIAGDMILAIDGYEIAGKTTDEVSKLLKGQAKTSVNLKVKRLLNENIEEVTLLREDIKIKDVPYYKVFENNIGYIKLTSFTQTASKEFLEALKDLKTNKQIKSLIIDLRGNGGGLLNEAVNIVNFFVPKGQDVVYTKGKVKQWDRTHKALNEPVDLQIPIAVLIDEMSASASEIVSGALQDIDRAVLVGQTSFGKGLVQQTRTLSYNAQLKVTVAKYYIPSGRCIQRIDYSHKDETGKANEIPDSLITEYKTKNGRKVYDGAGIVPDILVEPENFSPITTALMANQLYFDYASEFRKNFNQIDTPTNFHLTNEQYNDFVAYLNGKSFDYTTKTEKLLQDLKTATEKDKYYESVKESYENLEQKIKHNKADDLLTFKPEISRILENEIVSRYYYQTGRIEHNMSYDAEIKAAIEVLKDTARYNQILTGGIAKH